MSKRRSSFSELRLDWSEMSELETPSGVRRSPSQEFRGLVPPNASACVRRPSQELTRVAEDGGINDPRLEELRKLYAAGDAEAALKYAADLAPAKGEEPYADIQDSAFAARTVPPPAAPADSDDPVLTVDLEVDEESPADKEEGTAIFSTAVLTHLASLSGTPKITMTLSEVQKLPLDHRAGFLMSMIDGKSTIQDLCDLAGMPEDDVTGVLAELARQRCDRVRVTSFE